MIINIVLSAVVISHALACLTRGLSGRHAESIRLRREADSVYKAEDAGEMARRIVEILWFFLYGAVAWRIWS